MNKLHNFSDKKGKNLHSSHKITAECFTNCATWKMNATITINKTSIGLIFHGRAFLLKNFKNSVLNQFKIIDNVSDISKSTIKSLEEKALSEENNRSDTNLDFTQIKFPLNNTEYLQMTPALYEDLNNLIFIEFELNNSNNSKEKIKYIKEINNEFVDKDIHLVLNGNIHGKPIFKHDLTFTIEARKIIKSIQFRLEDYKNEFVEKQKVFERSNPNYEIKNSKLNFFTKLLTHQNVAVEFHKPSFDNVEKYATNFNSIVNSRIKIEKIYFELNLKKLNKVNKTESESKLLNESNNLLYSFSNFTDLTKTPSTDAEYEDNLSLTKGKNKSTTSVSSDNGILKYEYNNKKGIYSTSADITIYDGYFGYEYRSDYGYSYYSNNYSYSASTANSYHNNGYITSKETDANYYPELKNNNYINYTNISNNSYYNGNHCDNYCYTYDDPAYYYSFYEKNYHLNKSNGNSIGYNRKDISNNNYNYNKYNIFNNRKKSFNKTTDALQILLTHYEGMCNYLIFAKACTPYILKEDFDLVNKIKIINFFKNFEKVSAYGLDINFIHEKEIGNVNYSPSLSSMEIFFSDKYTCHIIKEEMLRLRKEKSEEKNFFDYLFEDNSEGNFKKESFIDWTFFEYNISDNLKIICTEEGIKIQYYETKPPHSRYILSHQLEQIFSKLKVFDSIDLSQLDKYSWFSVLWTPFKSNKQKFSNTSFLTYYQFNLGEFSKPENGNENSSMMSFNGYYEIPIIGILPIKFEENLWLKRFTRGKNNLTIFQGLSNYDHTSDIINFRMAVNDSVVRINI